MKESVRALSAGFRSRLELHAVGIRPLIERRRLDERERRPYEVIAAVHEALAKGERVVDAYCAIRAATSAAGRGSS